MRTQIFAAPSRWASSLGMAVLLAVGLSGLAKADITFNVNATVGLTVGSDLTGPYTGKLETGTITIDTVGGTITGLDLTVAGDPNQFTNYFGCPPTCTFNYNNGFDEDGLLDLGSTVVGYTGGSLLSDSYVSLDTPYIGQGPGYEGVANGGVAYSLSGTVSPVPEPRFYAGFLGLLMIGTGLVIRRRQRAQ